MPRRLPAPPGPGAREAAADHLRELIGTYGPVLGDLEAWRCPWPRRLASLEAGDPVVVHGWQVPVEHRPAGTGVNDVLLLAGDSVEVVDAEQFMTSPGRAPWPQSERSYLP